MARNRCNEFQIEKTLRLNIKDIETIERAIKKSSNSEMPVKQYLETLVEAKAARLRTDMRIK